MSRLTVLTAHFNPAGYHSHAANFSQFSDGIRAAGCDLLVAEQLFQGRTREIAGSYTFPGHGLNTLWQKERLLNLLLPLLPADCEYVAWIDQDILFRRSDWAAATIEALQTYRIVQPWEQAFDRMPDGTESARKRSSGWAAINEPRSLPNIGKFHPGYAWAARRDWLQDHKLFDQAIVGAGDILMLHALTDLPITCRDFAPRLTAAAMAWGTALRPHLMGHCGYVPGDILHLWHGERQHRHYSERQQTVRRHGFDPQTDLELDAAGLWQWTEHARNKKPRLIAYVRDYFRSRQEDGPPPRAARATRGAAAPATPPPPPPEPAWSPPDAVSASIRQLAVSPIAALMLGLNEPLAIWLAGILSRTSRVTVAGDFSDRERAARFEQKTRRVSGQIRKLRQPLAAAIHQQRPKSLDMVVVDADCDPAELLELLVLSGRALRPGGQILLTGLDGTDGEFVGGDQPTARDAVTAWQKIARDRWPLLIL
jgi:hypothetical protein